MNTTLHHYSIILLAFLLGTITSLYAQEVGTNDFRITTTGPNGNTTFSSRSSAITYNSTNDDFLVVWRGEMNNSSVDEIYGQLYDAATMNPINGPFRISSPFTTSLDHQDPAVAYNSSDNEYLVVWDADLVDNGTVDGEKEIYSQRVSSTGTLLGSRVKISRVGGTGNGNFDADLAAVAYNATDNQYMIVWEADDTSFPSVVDNEKEIYGQLVNASTGQLINTTIKISDVGPTGQRDANSPDIAWNSTDNQYLVIWDGNESNNNDFQIMGQRLSSTGSLIDNSISIMSTGGSDGDDARVVYNSTNNEYLVIADFNPVNTSRVDIYSRVVSNTGTMANPAVKISGLAGTNASCDQINPDLTYVPSNNEYAVVWNGRDNTSPLVCSESEVRLQRLDAANTEIGTDDERISDMGGSGNGDFDIDQADIAYSTTSRRLLMIWQSDDNENGSVNGELEIYGQFYDIPGNSLPVELVDFTATAINNETIELNWHTASENNNSHFIIQRSRKGYQDWEEIGRVEGNGTSLGTNYYAFTDAFPYTGTAYYRLVQTDFDGTTSKSSVKVVSITQYGNQTVDVYPNPARDELFIEGSKEELAEVRIFNMMGQEVNLAIINATTNRLTLNLSHLKPGIYSVNTPNTTQKIIHQ